MGNPCRAQHRHWFPEPQEGNHFHFFSIFMRYFNGLGSIGIHWDPDFLEVLAFAVTELQMYLPSLASLPPEGSNYVAATVAWTCLDLGPGDKVYDKVYDKVA